MKILLLGFGNMGQRLLPHLEGDITVVQPSLEGQKSFTNTRFIPDVEKLENDYQTDAVIVAVKPQIVDQVLPKLNLKCQLISIAASVTTDQLKKLMPTATSVVRLMPNVAMEVGQSANLAFATPNSDTKLATKLFEPTGPLFWLQKEEWFESLTPMAGSSPAFYFLFTEALINSALKLGIDPKVARASIKQAFLGSALLASQSDDLITLKKAVTSKGGVTEAALNVLDPTLPNLIEEAMEAALKGIV